MSFSLSASKVSRTYAAIGTTPSVEALASTKLTLQAGERLALIGPSGTGKSTLLGLLAGFDRPTTGEIMVNGRSLVSMSSNELAAYRRETVGFVFQSARLLPHLTARDNVALPLVLAGVPHRERGERANLLLARVGLTERHGHYPSQLSGGEQQRVALARALANRPRLLLADEPTAGLDRATADAIASWLFEIASEHDLAVVVATHDPRLAGQCDRVLRLGDRQDSLAA